MRWPFARSASVGGSGAARGAAGRFGFAVGAGAGIALLCDSIVLGESGALGFPFFRVGLTPDYGILYTLPRRVGGAKARQILLRAQMLKG